VHGAFLALVELRAVNLDFRLTGSLAYTEPVWSLQRTRPPLARRLYQLLVGSDGRLSVPGRLTQADPHQIRVLIFQGGYGASW